MEKYDTSEKLNNIIYFILRVSLYIMLPLIGMLIWIFISSSLILGEFKSTVDSVKGIFETFSIYSFSMLLFLAIFPLVIKVKGEERTLKDLGLIFVKSKRSIILLSVNLLVLGVMIIKFFYTKNSYYDNWAAVFIQILSIGVSEEIMLRSVLFDEVSKNFNVIITIIVTSLIFAFIYHSASDFMPNLLVRFPLGIVLAIFRVQTKSVYSSVVCHSWYNLLVITI